MSVILFFIVLFVLVIAHEFGHFIIAKKAGIRVDEFAFGFPPRLGSVKKGETRYSFNALPLGGYVKIFGEDPTEVGESVDKKRSFSAQPLYVQAAVIVAGVVFNLLLAWFLLTATLMIGIPAPEDGEDGYAVSGATLMVTGVRAGTPAELSGFASGDKLISLSDGSDTVIDLTPERVSEFIGPRENRPITAVYNRKGVETAVTLIPVSGIVPDAAAIGIQMDMVGTLQLPPHIALWEGLKKTYQYTVLTADGIYTFLKSAVMGESDFSQVTGPVGIVQAVGDAAGVGFSNLLLFTALISINLAVINVIPFPALDGGRLLFIVIEAVTRRPINVQVANMFNLGGFALLMLLMLLVTWHDISKLLL